MPQLRRAFSRAPGSREEAARSRERARRARDHQDHLAQAIEFGRATKRWIFPVLAILVTIVTIIYILNQRAPPEERFTLPRL